MSRKQASLRVSFSRRRGSSSRAGVPSGELRQGKFKGGSFSHLCSVVNGLRRVLEAGFLQRLRHIFCCEES